jgi:hypothetical protein
MIRALSVGYLCLLLLAGRAGVAQKSREEALTSYLRPAVFSLTMVMVHDVVDPPAASRYYAYALLGAYDLAARHNKGLIPASAFIRHYPAAEAEAEKDMDYDYRIAAAYSILETGRRMLPSGYLLEDEEKRFLEMLRAQKWSPAVIDRSLAAGRRATERMLAWSKGDGYNLLSARLRYTPLRKDSTWYPTPPAYMEAVEPHWQTIRPMMVDSANQFPPPSLTRFSTDTASAFYHLAREVYALGKDTGAKGDYQKTIAGFWDCNPFAIQTSGHMMIGNKKISPGAHWLNITAIASAVAGLDFDHTLEAQTLVAATLMDAFICCWEAKYRSNRIRPETYINRYIDDRWQPYLQTPPFPEYTSGHSVISTAAAEMLTYLLGERLDFTDNTEELWDIRPRSFHSFRQAAEEAAISRLYGGIHYRDGVVSGQVQGKAIGNWLVNHVKRSGIKPLR